MSVDCEYENCDCEDGRQVVRCSYRVEWSEEDNEFVATVKEFPSLSWVDFEPVAALAGLVALANNLFTDDDDDEDDEAD